MEAACGGQVKDRHCRLTRALRSGRREIDAEALIRAMVFNRLCDPTSKLGCLRWLETVAMPAMPDSVTHQHLLRAMDALMDHSDAVEDALARQVRPLVDRDLAVVFYDLTTVRIHGEGDVADDIRAYGMNKEMGGIARQFVLGVVQTADGLPLMHTVHPGNVGETKTLQGMLQTVLQRFPVQRVILVADPSAEPRDLNEVSAIKVTGLIARLLVVTGLRIGELTALRTRDVTGAATQIRVREKGDRERTVYVANDRLQADFRHYWKKRFDAQGSEAWLFANSKGAQLTPQAFRKRLRTLSRSLRIEPHLTPHRFRHSAATLLIEEGVDIRLVQRLLGHASIATTEIYTRVSDNSLSSAVVAADTLATVDA